ncbi:hypothetical protein ACF1CG_35815 [Streptomyces sp. NPDC014773]|uniref:hypothetical protein n=1 Tax=Streptomyces sp. NPDC014773 TaxID=3364908 RepID=UPI0037016A95
MLAEGVIAMVATREGQRMGAAERLVPATVVLLVEGTLAAVLLMLYGFTRPSPAVGGSALGVLALPVLLPFAAAFAAGLAIAFVLPTVWVGERFAGLLGERWERLGGGAAGLLPGGLLVAAVPLGAAVATGFCGVAAGAVLWLPAGAALAVAAAVSGSRRPRLLRAVLGWGALAVTGALVLGAVAFASGLVEEYRPPRLERAAFVGTWTDGRGGSMELAADGTATAAGLDDAWDSDGEERECAGRGTWTYEPGPGSWGQELVLGVASCADGSWYVGGTAERVVLYRFVGDPDSGDLYELTRAGDGS